MATLVLKADAAGQVLDKWRLIKRLGGGSFGTVYEAEHQVIPGRRAAVKILHPHLALDAEIQRRFINEANYASRAEHENIIQIFDGNVTPEGVCYVVMECLRGATLGEALRRGPLGVARTLAIGSQIASALAAVHRIGIVHRDLKPDNVFLVARDGLDFVKVLDFGIAKLREGDGGQHTKTGAWLGTPAYMAPEQWEARKDIDGRVDIYALGVILFQCLTGALPFHAEEPLGWMQEHQRTAPPDLAKILPGLPDGLAALVLRMLAKRPEDRPQSMAEVKQALDALRQLLGTAPVIAVSVPRRWPRVVLLIALGCLGLGMSGSALWMLLRPAEATNDAPPFDLAVDARSEVSATPDLLSPPVQPPDAALALAVLPAAPERVQVAAPQVRPPAPRPRRQLVTLRLETEPAGVTVLLPGDLRCENAPRPVTPWVCETRRDERRAAVTLQRPGFIEKRVLFDLSKDESRTSKMVPLP